MKQTKCQAEFEKWLKNRNEPYSLITDMWQKVWCAAWQAASRQLINKEINKLERRFKSKGKKDATKNT
jgi:sarcosine oxidase delta subunit